MAIGVGLNTLFVVAEIVCGFFAGSLALVADAGHNAGDVIGLLLAWGASWLARRPPSERYTWGFRRTTIYAALANAVLLLTACGAILWEAAHRLRTPEPVAGLLVIAVATIGVVINTATALLFMRGQRDANVRGAFLHMAADAAISAGVAVAGILILVTGMAWIDPVVSIVITVAIVAGTWGLFRESVDLALVPSLLGLAQRLSKPPPLLLERILLLCKRSLRLVPRPQQRRCSLGLARGGIKVALQRGLHPDKVRASHLALTR